MENDTKELGGAALVVEQPAAKKVAVRKAPAKKAVAKKATAKKASVKKVAAKKAPAKKASPSRAKPTAPVSAPATKAKKVKLVRDSFTMPANEYQILQDIKKASLKAGVEVKKSELLRIGVGLLKTLSVAQLDAARSALTKLRAGRPKK